jgi:hypothetical protein
MKRALSKADIRRVERAAEMILTGDYRYSCLALYMAKGSAGFGRGLLLARRFQTFYEKGGGSWWPHDDDYRNQRATALLFFAYAPADAVAGEDE